MDSLLECPGCKAKDGYRVELDCGHNFCYPCLDTKKKEEEYIQQEVIEDYLNV
jgi:hypothetical protein